MSDWRVSLELEDSKTRGAAITAIDLEGLSDTGEMIYAYADTRQEGERLLDRIGRRLSASDINVRLLELDHWLPDQEAWSGGKKPSSDGAAVDGVIQGLLGGL